MSELVYDAVELEHLLVRDGRAAWPCEVHDFVALESNIVASARWRVVRSRQIYRAQQSKDRIRAGDEVAYAQILVPCMLVVIVAD